MDRTDCRTVRRRREPHACAGPHLERAAEAERLFQILRATGESELRQFARLLASKPDRQLSGKTEFEVRDLAYGIEARAVEADLSLRETGDIRGPA